MFTTFFYLLRDKGLNVSLNEWMNLLEALNKGLCGSSLMNFYHLCRAILVKSEVDYDRLDLAFAEYFYNIETIEQIPEEVWEWLNKEVPEKYFDEDRHIVKHSLEEVKRLLEERLKEQDAEHNGGSKWIGTQGITPFGHSGTNPAGIRIGGKSRNRSAVKIAGERHFKDFRQDTILDIRQFQMAFRKLRQFSSRVEGAKTELDIDATIEETGNNAGNLKLVWDRPRTNTIKVLLLMDSGGSMWMHSDLCNRLFQAVHKSNHFKDLQTYYFHNCIYDDVYSDHSCSRNKSIDTEWILKKYDSDYHVIIVGDASMAQGELLHGGGNVYLDISNEKSGIEWLNRIRKKYSKSIWLNPIQKRHWPYTYTIRKIAEVFPMFDLTLEGLDAGIKKLKATR
ncbi:VWA containing CoxE family protein [Wukongibacter baidiensis]|uniref:vWA domain-containing protein n=1 Tax=Wukongibacter baidiensis TaxID=1723361 RepID=UPI003D7FD851